MSKSIEQLENNYWPKKNIFPSDLVKRCYEYRKIPISNLSIEQLRVLISQDIGIKFILETSLNKVARNPIAEGDLYEGDLLVALSKTNIKYWDLTKLNHFKQIISDNKNLIQIEIGEKSYNKILERVQKLRL